jgi:hypothetical protein
MFVNFDVEELWLTYHKRESDWDGFDGFDGPEDTKTQYLKNSKDVYPVQLNMTEVCKVWLIFNWLHKQEKTVDKLKNKDLFIHVCCHYEIS